MAFIQPFLKNTSPARQLFALFIIALISLSIVSLFSVLGAPLFGLGLLDLQSLEERLNDPSVMAYMKFSQVLSALGLFLLPPFVFMLLRGEKALHALRLDRMPPPGLVLGAIFLMIIQLPLINATALFNNSLSLPSSLGWLEQIMRDMETSAGKITEVFLDMNGTGDFLTMLFIMAVLPAIGEELLFRSTLQPILTRLFRNPHLGIWVTAFIFSFIHFQFFGFIPRFLIGAFLGYLFYYSGNTWIPAAAHFTNNGLAVTGTWLLKKGLIPSSPDELGVGEQGVWQCLVSLILLGIGLYWFVKVSRPLNPAEE